MASVNLQQMQPIIGEEEELRITFSVGVASFTALVWDHMITLDDEIQYIWKQKKGPLIWLFFINRYLTPLGFVINLFAYFSGVFTHETCKQFVRYEGSMTVIGINITALMMLLRIYAMYGRQSSIVIFVAVIFAIEFGVNAWLLSYGIAVPHSPGIRACTMIFDTTKVPGSGSVAAASAWLPLIYDTIVLVLTIRRTFMGVRAPTMGRTMAILLKEGVLYYSVIFSCTLVLTMMIVIAPNGLKNVTAQTEYLMTVAMMSRITLHLKKKTHNRTITATGSQPTYGLISTTMSHMETVTPIWSTTQSHSALYDHMGIQIPKKAHPFADRERGRDEWIEFSTLGNRTRKDSDTGRV